MTTPAPKYSGTIVRRISREPDGLTLWLRFPRTQFDRAYTLDRARRLLIDTPEGTLHNELSDAIRLCDIPPGRAPAG